MLQRFKIAIMIALSMSTVLSYADNIKLFPLGAYSQNVDMWLNPASPGYHAKLLDSNYQQQRLHELQHTYFGTGKDDNSPWSQAYIDSIISGQTAENSISTAITLKLDQFDNTEQASKSLTFASNYHPYSVHWMERIEKSVNITQFNNLKYIAKNRAIATDNLQMRALPTDDPAYLSNKIAGEGYPFDNLQLTAVYAGTPLYILGVTVDRSWSLVMAPEYIGWVKSNGIGRVNDGFIQQWQRAAYTNLAGIKQNRLSIISQYGSYQFDGYVGMILPVDHKIDKNIEVLIPIKQANGTAVIAHSSLSPDTAAILPLSATPANFAMLFKSLQGRPYGWGGLGFYNDCSAEMKAIFTMFGFFMPRNTDNQVFAGKVVDLAKLSGKERSDYLIKNGTPLLTMIHTNGHILLYVGAYTDSKGSKYALSYQQMWGLYPKDKSSRSVIGQAVFLPLLTTYAEDTTLDPQLNRSLFKLIYLDQFPEKPLKQTIGQLLGN